MNGVTTHVINGIEYIVDAAAGQGRYAVAYHCPKCQWSHCTPLRGTPTDAMDAALDAIEAHHADFHGTIQAK